MCRQQYVRPKVRRCWRELLVLLLPRGSHTCHHPAQHWQSPRRTHLLPYHSNHLVRYIGGLPLLRLLQAIREKRNDFGTGHFSSFGCGQWGPGQHRRRGSNIYHQFLIPIRADDGRRHLFIQQSSPDRRRQFSKGIVRRAKSGGYISTFATSPDKFRGREIGAGLSPKSPRFANRNAVQFSSNAPGKGGMRLSKSLGYATWPNSIRLLSSNRQC